MKSDILCASPLVYIYNIYIQGEAPSYVVMFVDKPDEYYSYIYPLVI